MVTLIGGDDWDGLTGGNENDTIDLRGSGDVGNGEGGDDLIMGRRATTC